MAAINIKFQTDQTGANSNVCSGTSMIFNFSLTDTYNLVSADISLKKGSGTTESIIASVYDQKNGAGNLVASSTVLAADITQSYTSIIFVFSNVSLSPGISYSLVLNSTSSCSGNSPYSMKSGNFQVLNADTNTLLNTGYGISASASAVSTLIANSSLSPTPTPSPTATITPTITTTRSPTPTSTQTVTPSITSSITPTVSPSITISNTTTSTPTPSITPSITLSNTPTITPSITVSNTPTLTPEITPSITPSITQSVTPTLTITTSITPSISKSPIPTPSNTPNAPKTPHMGGNHIRFKLGNKNPKIYRGRSVIYDPPNN